MLRKLTLAEYINTFGTVLDMKTKEYVPFRLWPKQRKLCDALENSKECLIPKARQLGISEICAEEAVKLCLQQDRTHVVFISKTETDAIYFLAHKVLPKIDNLPQVEGLVWPKHKAKTQVINLSNGSIIEALAPSNLSGASMVVDMVVFDEAGGIDLQPGVDLSKMYRNIKPTLEKADGKVRMVGTSEAGSYFNEMVRESYMTAYEDRDRDCFFLPADADPNRTKEWFEKQKRMFPSDADFKTQYPFKINDFFAVREGLIFPLFDDEEGGQHVREFEPASYWDLYDSYDHGFRHNAVLLEVYHDRRKDILYVESELCWSGVQADVIADEMVERINMRKRPPTLQIADSQIFAETGTRPISEIFSRKGIYFSKSIKTSAKSGMDWSTANIAERLREGKLVIHPRCESLINEFLTWRWNAKTKGEKPVDENNDGIDALRYVCAQLQPGVQREAIEEKRTGYRKKQQKKGRRAVPWYAL